MRRHRYRRRNSRVELPWRRAVPRIHVGVGGRPRPRSTFDDFGAAGRSDPNARLAFQRCSRIPEDRPFFSSTAPCNQKPSPSQSSAREKMTPVTSDTSRRRFATGHRTTAEPTRRAANVTRRPSRRARPRRSNSVIGHRLPPTPSRHWLMLPAFSQFVVLIRGVHWRRTVVCNSDPGSSPLPAVWKWGRARCHRHPFFSHQGRRRVRPIASYSTSAMVS